MQNESRPTVELKGFHDGMRLIVDPEASMERIEQAIVERMASLGDSLSGMTMNIDLGSRSLDDEELVRLKSLLNENYGLEVKQIIGDAQDDPKRTEASHIAGVPALHGGERIYNQLAPMNETNEETRFIRHTLRSGQIERALEGNMVILGDVNPGAEVVAAGDIVVLGTLRGVAHAGGLGNTSSIIFALNLLPTQLRIGRFITRPPAGKQRRHHRPEIARVLEDAIVVEEYD
jgi:septum site-determining protein MinC